MSVEQAIALITQFKGDSLTETISSAAYKLGRADVAQVHSVNQAYGVNDELLVAAATVKLASAQIDIVIHTVGILYALPHILQNGEVVESVSLGADSARSGFDLVTDRRIAEFKFICWQGGSEAARKKTVFGDFYKLVREQTTQTKYLYLLNAEIPLNFLQHSTRSVLAVLDKRLVDDFAHRYGNTDPTVQEYYGAHQAEVQIVDLIEVAPEFQLLTDLPE